MEEDIKTYADSLYESTLMDSVQALQEAQRSNSQQRASRSKSPLPISGFDIQAILTVYSDHVDRCMTARFESYERAFNETGRIPSEQDFTAILNESKQARLTAIRHSAGALTALVNSPSFGNVPSVPTETTLTNSSAHGHDRILRRWNVWKAKSRLKPEAAAEKKVEKQRDALLPIYNRAEFDSDLNVLALASSTGSPLSLIFMDLDKFKSINDGPGGHSAGDRALQAFAEVAFRACNGKGTAYRYGGDELCVLLPNHSTIEACTVAERIRQEVQAIRTTELPDGLSTSIGVACLPESKIDMAGLVHAADSTMYISKNAGGNRVSSLPSGLGVTLGGTDQKIERSRGVKDAEIAVLNERIAQLSRRPYAEALARIVRQLLDQMTLEGRHVLHHLMIHAPVEIGRTLVSEIPQNRTYEQLEIAVRDGVVRREEETQGLRRTYWTISSRFRPVLEDLLYEDGRL
jgi:diguanylate cyclase (GGDEF)-like protein